MHEADGFSGKTLVLQAFPSCRQFYSSSPLDIYLLFDGHSRFYILLLEVLKHPLVWRSYLTIAQATAAAELVGKMVFSQGLATSFRPRKYYTIPRESLEASLEDVEQLINFFVIEFQRVLFAENVVHTIAASAAAVISYWLIKFLPLWGLSLIGVSTIYLGPLIYISNKEVIDQQLNNATQVVNSQASQVRDLAGHHAERATNTVKAYAGDYSAKAQTYIGGSRGRSNSPELSNSGIKSEPPYNSADFPRVPKQEPVSGTTPLKDQYEKSQFGGQAQPAY